MGNYDMKNLSNPYLICKTEKRDDMQEEINNVDRQMEIFGKNKK